MSITLLISAAAVGVLAFLIIVRDVEPAWLIGLGLGLSCFSGNWRYMSLPPSLDRVLLLSGIALALVKAIRSGGARAVPLAPVHLVLGLLLAYAFASALWSGTLDDSVASLALVDKFGALPFALFFIAPIAFADERQRRILLVCLLWLGAYLSLTAILEGVGLSQLVLPRYIDDASIGITTGRARGPFAAADANGQALFFCAVGAAVAMWTWRRVRVVAGAVLIGCVFGILFTLTRQVWLAGGAGALVTMLAVAQLRRYTVLAVAGVGVMVVVALAGIPGFYHRVDGRLSDKSPVWDRYNSNSAAIRMVEARPLVGFGWYSFATDSRPYFELAGDYPLTTVYRVHNVFLSNAAELGLVMAVLWALALLFAVGRGVLERAPPGLDPWRAGLLAVAVCWLVIANFTPLGYAFSNYSLWLWAGVVAAGWIRRPVVIAARHPLSAAA